MAFWKVLQKLYHTYSYLEISAVAMYISWLCILCGFKFHRYLLVKNFCVFNFTQKLPISRDFCVRQHGNEGFLFLLADGPLCQYQLVINGRNSFLSY